MVDGMRARREVVFIPEGYRVLSQKFLSCGLGLMVLRHVIPT